jgi:FlaA1/EpsC-like NDP-sugar epimerase
MSIRMRRPETVKLEISRGDWLLVKKFLTTGENRDMLKAMRRDRDGDDRIDQINVGWARSAWFLLDWSLQDPDGKVIPILDKAPEDIGRALDGLPLPDFKEVREAIEAHIERVDAELEAEKNAAGESASSAISPSAA